MGLDSQKAAQWVLLALLLSLVGAIAVLSCVPPVSRDELTHHLVVPKLYLAHGGIFEIPWIVFSYYPMNLDLLYMLPLYLGSDIAAKFVHFSFALMTAGLLFRYLRKNSIPATACLVLWYSFPFPSWSSFRLPPTLTWA